MTVSMTAASRESNPSCVAALSRNGSRLLEPAPPDPLGAPTPTFPQWLSEPPGNCTRGLRSSSTSEFASMRRVSGSLAPRPNYYPVCTTTTTTTTDRPGSFFDDSSAIGRLFSDSWSENFQMHEVTQRRSPDGSILLSSPSDRSDIQPAGGKPSSAPACRKLLPTLLSPAMVLQRALEDPRGTSEKFGNDHELPIAHQNANLSFPSTVEEADNPALRAIMTLLTEGVCSAEVHRALLDSAADDTFVASTVAAPDTRCSQQLAYFPDSSARSAELQLSNIPLRSVSEVPSPTVTNLTDENVRESLLQLIAGALSLNSQQQYATTATSNSDEFEEQQHNQLAFHAALGRACELWPHIAPLRKDYLATTGSSTPSPTSGRMMSPVLQPDDFDYLVAAFGQGLGKSLPPVGSILEERVRNGKCGVDAFDSGDSSNDDRTPSTCEAGESSDTRNNGTSSSGFSCTSSPNHRDPQPLQGSNYQTPDGSNRSSKASSADSDKGVTVAEESASQTLPFHSPQQQKELLQQLLSRHVEDHEIPPNGSSGDTTSSPLLPGRTSLFAKTKMCRFFSTGTCTKGERCDYAHSLSEIREAPNLQKTKLCLKHRRGRCTLSESTCPFAHGFEELRATENFFKTKLCMFWLSGHCKAGSSCRHAHGHEEVRQEEESPTATTTAAPPHLSVGCVSPGGASPRIGSLARPPAYSVEIGSDFFARAIQQAPSSFSVLPISALESEEVVIDNMAIARRRLDSAPSAVSINGARKASASDITSIMTPPSIKLARQGSCQQQTMWGTTQNVEPKKKPQPPAPPSPLQPQSFHFCPHATPLNAGCSVALPSVPPPPPPPPPPPSTAPSRSPTVPVHHSQSSTAAKKNSNVRVAQKLLQNLDMQGCASVNAPKQQVRDAYEQPVASSASPARPAQGHRRRSGRKSKAKQLAAQQQPPQFASDSSTTAQQHHVGQRGFAQQGPQIPSDFAKPCTSNGISATTTTTSGWAPCSLPSSPSERRGGPDDVLPACIHTGGDANGSWSILPGPQCVQQHRASAGHTWLTNEELLHGGNEWASPVAAQQPQLTCSGSCPDADQQQQYQSQQLAAAASGGGFRYSLKHLRLL